MSFDACAASHLIFGPRLPSELREKNMGYLTGKCGGGERGEETPRRTFQARTLPRKPTILLKKVAILRAVRGVILPLRFARRKKHNTNGMVYNIYAPDDKTTYITNDA